MSRSYIVGILIGVAMPLFLYFIALPMSLKADALLQWRFRINGSITILCAVLIMIFIFALAVFPATYLSDELAPSHAQYVGGFALGFLLGGAMAAILSMLGVGPFKRHDHPPRK